MDSREGRPCRRPLVTVQECGDRHLADSEGARRQRTGFRLRWFPPSAVQTRIDGDGKAGFQIHGPLQHEHPFAFIASFHAHTVTRVYRPDHWSEVPSLQGKGPLPPTAYGPFGPLVPWSPLWLGRERRFLTLRRRSASILSRVEGLTDLGSASYDEAPLGEVAPWVCFD